MKEVALALAALAAAMSSGVVINPDPMSSRQKTPGLLGMQSIDDGSFVRVNGVDQWVTLRGRHAENPALLIVTGPGVAFSVMAPLFAPWEEDWTIVQWDQPGAGATQAKNGDAGTGPLTIDRLVKDGIAVAESVRARLHMKKLAVLAVSGGTIVGLNVVKRRPDLFSAYVGTGQIVNWQEQDAHSYRMVLGHARARADEKAIAELEAIGPPPYKDTATDAVKSRYATALTPGEEAAFAAIDPSVMAAIRNPPVEARYVARGLPSIDARAQSLAAYDKLRREIVSFDARTLGVRFRVPMFFFQGEHDMYTVTAAVQTYATEIRAPQQRFVPIPGGGHSSFFMREVFADLLSKYARPVAIANSR